MAQIVLGMASSMLRNWRCRQRIGGPTETAAARKRSTGSRARPTRSESSRSCAPGSTSRGSAPTRSSRLAGTHAKPPSGISKERWRKSRPTYASSWATTRRSRSAMRTCLRSPSITGTALTTYPTPAACAASSAIRRSPDGLPPGRRILPTLHSASTSSRRSSRTSSTWPGRTNSRRGATATAPSATPSTTSTGG